MDTEVALISDVIKFIETFICQFWKHLTSLAFAFLSRQHHSTIYTELRLKKLFEKPRKIEKLECSIEGLQICQCLELHTLVSFFV